MYLNCRTLTFYPGLIVCPVLAGIVSNPHHLDTNPEKQLDDGRILLTCKYTKLKHLHPGADTGTGASLYLHLKLSEYFSQDDAASGQTCLDA